MRVRISIASRIIGAAIAVLGAGSAAGQEGPDHLTEVYRDWVVRCSPENGNRICRMTQELTQSNSGQRVVMADLRTGADAESLAGVMYVPFGILVAEPVRLAVDDEPLADLAVRTCVPGGCVVPVTLASDDIAILRNGQTLTVVLAGGGQEPITVNMSLAGFTAARNRLEELASR